MSAADTMFVTPNTTNTSPPLPPSYAWNAARSGWNVTAVMMFAIQLIPMPSDEPNDTCERGSTSGIMTKGTGPRPIEKKATANQ